MISTSGNLFLLGATGQIGTRLVNELVRLGRPSTLLTRNPEKAISHWDSTLTPDKRQLVQIVGGDPQVPGDWQAHIAEATGVVNLVGESLFAKRWSTSFKQTLRDSRTRPTALIRKTLIQANNRCPWVNASAIGFYGASGPGIMDESSPPGNDFLASLSCDWERELFSDPIVGQRRIALRTGIVLDPNGGALAKMLPLFRWGIGGALGLGTYPTSWIHQADITGLIIHALDCEKVDGPLNGVSPHPVSNREFAKTLAKVLHRPALFPAPVFALRTVLGEVAMAIASGREVRPRVALETGYSFRFPFLEGALTDLLC